MMDAHELEAESAELLPGREALGKLKFSFNRTTNVTKHVATVQASNSSLALNDHSVGVGGELRRLAGHQRHAVVPAHRLHTHSSIITTWKDIHHEHGHARARHRVRGAAAGP